MTASNCLKTGINLSELSAKWRTGQSSGEPCLLRGLWSASAEQRGTRRVCKQLSCFPYVRLYVRTLQALKGIGTKSAEMDRRFPSSVAIPPSIAFVVLTYKQSLTVSIPKNPLATT
jgi:hypothetical protein